MVKDTGFMKTGIRLYGMIIGMEIGGLENERILARRGVAFLLILPITFLDLME